METIKSLFICGTVDKVFLNIMNTIKFYSSSFFIKRRQSYNHPSPSLGQYIINMNDCHYPGKDKPKNINKLWGYPKNSVLC